MPAMWFNDETGEEVPASKSGGLFVKGRDGETHRVSIPLDCLAFQIGEAAQILSGGILKATPHHVRGHQAMPGEPPVSRETFALFIEPQWDYHLSPPTGVSYDSVLKGEERVLIPPLSKRLHPDPKTNTVEFGKLLADSFAVYYAHNNPGGSEPTLTSKIAAKLWAQCFGWSCFDVPSTPRMRLKEKEAKIPETPSTNAPSSGNASLNASPLASP